MCSRVFYFSRSVFLLISAIAALGPCERLAAQDVLPRQTPSKLPANRPAEAQCRQWGMSLQKALRSGDFDRFNQLIDWNALLERATVVSNSTAALAERRADFIRGAVGSLVGASDGFGPRIAEETKSGSYTFLRVQLVDGHRQALFRMITGMGALNYHGYIFDGPTAGSLRAIDCYVFLTGEPLSATLHRSFLPLVALDQNGVDHVPAADKDVVTYASQLSDIAKLSRDKKYAEVLDAYKHLPPAMQKSKSTLALRLIAAQSVSEDQYLQAIDDFRKNYPNDAMIDLISLDGYLLRKSFDQALEALNHIDKAVGGDPYLKTMRAVVLNMQGKTDLAYRFAKEASADEPTLPNNHFFLINLALKRRDFATTLAELQTLESKCSARFKDLTTVPAYAEFVKSPQYQTWLASRSAKH
jgi:hypothetical protein